MAKTRTFLGIAPSEGVAESAQRLVSRLRAIADNVKWVEPKNLHWTLHFLGELTDQELYEVCQAVENAAEQQSPFTLNASGVGAFPKVEKPRTVWLGATEGAEQMIGLHDALKTQLEPLGFRGENRRFVPHLTLGRAGRDARPGSLASLSVELTDLADFDAGTQHVDEVIVYGSRLRREGPEYTVLARSPLG